MVATNYNCSVFLAMTAASRRSQQMYLVAKYYSKLKQAYNFIDLEKKCSVTLHWQVLHTDASQVWALM